MDPGGKHWPDSKIQGDCGVKRAIASMLLSGVVIPAFAQETLPAAGPAAAAGFLDAAGPVAAAQLEHFGVITSLMLLIVVPIFLIVPWILVRYRRGGRGAYRPDWEFNWGIETIIWGLPIILVVMLSTALWAHARKYDPYRPLGADPLVVEVVSLDWKFLFLYPEQGIATVDYLALPQDRPVTLKLTSGTVMQSFMVPQLAGQIYAMAGMTTQLNLSANRAGEYLGRNTQYNGNGFATQSFRTVVMPKDAFNTWVQTTQKTAQSLDWTGYEAMVSPSIVHEPSYFGSFEAGLFDRVVASFAPQMVSGQPKPHAGQLPAVSTDSHEAALEHGHNHQQHSTTGVQQ
jgi:cytochrome o ubiquinol oxidase subunit 2